MTINGTLSEINGRKVMVGVDSEAFYLRKGVNSDDYLPLLQSEVEVEYEEEKGFKMVKEIKPSLPATEVEKTGPVDMLPSANVPKLDFNAGPSSYTTVTGSDKVEAKQVMKFDPKQRLITASWALGAVLNSHALAQCNDSIALNTVQTMERAKKLALELIKFVEEQSAK